MSNNRILFVMIPEKGHVNPMIGVAQHLQAAGYELAFFAQGDISEQLQKAGLPQRIPGVTQELAARTRQSPAIEIVGGGGSINSNTSPTPDNSIPGAFARPGSQFLGHSRYNTGNSSEKLVTRGKAFVDQLKDSAWLRHWIRTLLIDMVPSQVDLIRAAVADFNPALIVADPMVYAAAIVALERAIPWAGVSSSLNPITPDSWVCELTETLKMWEVERTAVLERYGAGGLRFKVSDAISPWLNIVFSTEEYMPRAACGNDFSFYVGNCFPVDSRGDETGFPFDRLRPQAKKVYMSMGSQIYYHPELFAAVADALADEDIQLIFSLNELLHTPFAKQLSHRIISVAYAPQLQLLKQVDLMITHGGANSVLESLAHGVPVALLPICNDQFLQAQFVARAAVGTVLDPSQPVADTYRQQLLPLLESESPVRKNAHRIGESFKRHGGSLEAATLIRRLFDAKQPMMPK